LIRQRTLQLSHTYVSRCCGCVGVESRWSRVTLGIWGVPERAAPTALMELELVVEVAIPKVV
jgi:hypothetical protein